MRAFLLTVEGELRSHVHFPGVSEKSNRGGGATAVGGVDLWLWSVSCGSGDTGGTLGFPTHMCWLGLSRFESAHQPRVAAYLLEGALPQHTWFQWMSRHEASAELDDELIIGIRCVWAGKCLKHAEQRDPWTSTEKQFNCCNWWRASLEYWSKKWLLFVLNILSKNRC